jgi:rubrerythrin
MNAYDFAMQMERDGERYYCELAEKTENNGLKSILTMLAEAEVAHYRLFRDMKANLEVRAHDTRILEEVKNVFQELKETGPMGVDSSQTELYRKALDIEKKSRDFYLAKVEETEDNEQRGVLLRIAGEESRHHQIVEGILDFGSRPEQWLEDAEWYHLQDY